MQEFNIINLLESYGIEIVVAAVVACVAAIVARGFMKLSAKTCLIIAFAVGAVVAFALGMTVFKLSFNDSVSKGITAGALALVITSFTKKLAFMDKTDVKANLEKLLSSIVLSDELDKVVNEIIEKIKQDASFSEQSLKEVLKDNVDANIDDATLDLVAKFILKALGEKEDV